MNVRSLLFFILSVSLPFYNYALPGFGFSLSSLTVVCFCAVWSLRLLDIEPGFFVIRKDVVSVVIALSTIFILLYLSSILNSGGMSAGYYFSYLFPKFLYALVPVLYLLSSKSISAAIVSVMSMQIGLVLGFVLVGNGYFESIRELDGRLDMDVRTTGVFSNFGDVGIVAGSTLAIALFSGIIYRSFWSRAVLLFLALFSISVALYYTQSRGLFVSMVLVCFLYLNFALYRKIRFYQYVILFLLCVILILFSGVGLFNSYGGLLENEGRIVQYARGISGFSDTVLLGAGIDGYKINYDPRWNIHNLLINVMYSGGIIAISALLFLFFKALSESKLGSGIDSFRRVFFFATMTPCMFFPATNSIIFWYILGVVIGLPLVNPQSNDMQDVK